MTLESIISDIESANNRYAMRFEPHVYQRTGAGKYGEAVTLAKARNKCSFETARVIVATSWSKFQIMGFNLYDPHGLDYPGCIGEYLNDDMQQAHTFRTFCERRGIYFMIEELQDEANIMRFATVYNGPGNPTAYAEKIRQRLVNA